MNIAVIRQGTSTLGYISPILPASTSTFLGTEFSQLVPSFLSSVSSSELSFSHHHLSISNHHHQPFSLAPCLPFQLLCYLSGPFLVKWVTDQYIIGTNAQQQPTLDGWMDGWMAAPFSESNWIPIFCVLVKMITDLAVPVGCMGASRRYAHIPFVLPCRYMASRILLLSLGMSELAPCILTW